MSARPIVLRMRQVNGTQQLLAPTVGIFAPSVSEGQLVSAGQAIGTVETLRVTRRLVIPNGVVGRVSARIGGQSARVPVQYGDVLIVVSTTEVAEASAATAPDPNVDTNAPTFAAPMSGRFYSRPSPTEAPFVAVGDTVTRGQTIGLLEVMKTFNRLVYQGEGLPERADVTEIVPSDGDDVVRGDPILRLGLGESD